MDFKRLNDYAIEASRNVLQSGFDFVAFIAYAIAVNNVNATEYTDIQGTDIDDSIKTVFGDFAKYYQKKNSGEPAEEEIEKMLRTMERILTELYYQGTQSEKSKICGCIADLAKTLNVGGVN